ncbi:prepilin-type N-terminal cleavage/methylation domain-containing protein [Erwinia sp.]|uniref:prepilin-type N-terminal cleavage/methylation domain-containing protein n=1 Tax=Erwinia citreus TaxID=558 RepID=UPI00289DF523|nr:prepilin-type N-terminal cleavage/methylation domain-containing protein [Erwinia sp.]
MGAQGFSLPETLVALLLFSISSLALIQYQLALGRGFQLQQQQREAVRLARQRFEGYQAPGWQTTLEQQTLTGSCLLLTSRVISPVGAKAALSQLRCINEDEQESAGFSD